MTMRLTRSSSDTDLSRTATNVAMRRHSLGADVTNLQNANSPLVQVPNVIQAQGNLRVDARVNLQADNIAENISNIENTGSSFIQRLRDLRARAASALSTAWQWVRNNVLCCCFPSAATIDEEVDDLTEVVDEPHVDQDEAAAILSMEALSNSLADSAERLERLNQLQLNLPENLMDRHTTAIVSFFYGLRNTPSGVGFSDILNYLPNELTDLLSFDPEFIPHMFPLPMAINPAAGAPLLNPNTREIFTLNPPLRNLYLQGVMQVMACWRLRLDRNGMVRTMPGFGTMDILWLQNDSTHRLHMKHMLQSLVELGFLNIAKSLKNYILMKSASGLVDRTIQRFWFDTFFDLELIGEGQRAGQYAAEDRAFLSSAARSSAHMPMVPRLRVPQPLPDYETVTIPIETYHDEFSEDLADQRVYPSEDPPPYEGISGDGAIRVDGSINPYDLPPSYEESNWLASEFAADPDQNN